MRLLRRLAQWIGGAVELLLGDVPSGIPSVEATLADLEERVETLEACEWDRRFWEVVTAAWDAPYDWEADR
jgi:hypothetical protein